MASKSTLKGICPISGTLSRGRLEWEPSLVSLQFKMRARRKEDRLSQEQKGKVYPKVIATPSSSTQRTLKAKVIFCKMISRIITPRTLFNSCLGLSLTSQVGILNTKLISSSHLISSLFKHPTNSLTITSKSITQTNHLLIFYRNRTWCLTRTREPIYSKTTTWRALIASIAKEARSPEEWLRRIIKLICLTRQRNLSKVALLGWVRVTKIAWQTPPQMS